MEGQPDPFPLRAARRRAPWLAGALAALLALPAAWAGEDAAPALPPPTLRRLPGRPVAGPVAPPTRPEARPGALLPPRAPRPPPPGGLAPSPSGLPGLRPPALPRDPAALPPPSVRRLPGRVIELPGGPAPEAATTSPPARPVLPAAGGAGGGLVNAPARPARPSATEPAAPEDLLFQVERPGGVVKRTVEEGGAVAYVMVGNPRVSGQAHTRADGQEVSALSIKADVLVAWVDESRLPELSRAAGGDDADADGAPAGLGSVFEEAVLGIYAEGAVEVVYGALAFRAEVLHFEPRTFRGLMIEPRFEGRFVSKERPAPGLPVYTRARRGRLVASGLMVFDDAEVSTTRADDRIALRVRSLTVEEYGQAEAAELGAGPALLGFRGLSTQRYRARQIQLRGERLPLFYVPYASFGLGKDAFPVQIKRVDAGSRSGLGVFAFVGIGDSLGPEEDPWLDWVLDVGGYTKRGPAAGLTLTWDRPGRTRGEVQGWGVYFDQGTDRDGFDPDSDVRGRITAESRSVLAPDLQLDVEFNSFSDRHFNREFFERDSLTHKERESYVRLLYRPGPWAASLTGKWHQRNFVTETVEAPQAGLWLGSLPLITPAAVGGLGVDLTSVTRAGYLGRRFDEELADLPYDALRVDHESRLEAGVSAGDVRVSGWVGVAGTSYGQRNDGGEDLVRAALLSGVRTNLQAHRAYAGRGGLFELDGLRHVVDLEASLEGRFLDTTDPADVPFFDERELLEERTEVALRARQRLQTRRPRPKAAPGAAPAEAGLRDVLDLETAFHWYLEDTAPWLQDVPWALTWSLRGEPREGGKLLVGSEGELDGRDGLVAATLAAGWKPWDRVDVALAYRWLLNEASAPYLQVSWRYSEKYSLRVTESYNFRDESNVFRFLLRRYSDDHVISFGLRIQDSDDVGFEFDLRPAIGGLIGDSGTLFEGEVDLDPTRAFR